MPEKSSSTPERGLLIEDDDKTFKDEALQEQAERRQAMLQNLEVQYKNSLTGKFQRWKKLIDQQEQREKRWELLVEQAKQKDKDGVKGGSDPSGGTGEQPSFKKILSGIPEQKSPDENKNKSPEEPM